MNWRRFLLPIARLYWRAFRPRTFGIKAFIFHPGDRSRILLVHHTYGSSNLLNLPGGGYNPKKETPIQAAEREIREELNVELLNPKEIYTYKTESEGKRDTVIVVYGTILQEDFKLDREISSYTWMTPSDILANGDIARVARHTIRHLEKHDWKSVC